MPAMPTHSTFHASSTRRQQAGFTLVEIIVGIVVLGIALSLITSLILPAARQSVEPVYQVRASALGQALLDEIMALSFDPNNDRSGGAVRCGSSSDRPNCAAPVIPGQRAANPKPRNEFSSVDDFNGIDQLSLALNVGEQYAERYRNFGVAIATCYVNSVSVSAGVQQVSDCVNQVTDYKQVRVVITTPSGQDIAFTGVRGNY